jgi:2-phospho-L-lactate/phosphoenolpyruvate guanylyltransferase
MPDSAQPPSDVSRTWAIVPIRGLETSKTRLGEHLDAEERVELVAELLRRTLVAARDAGRIAGTVLVTKDPAAAGLAAEHRAVGLVERASGLNEAIAAARSVAIARDATAILVLPADLPAVSAEYVDALIETAARFEAPSGLVATVPDRHGEGTNVLLLSPPEIIEPAFGPGSRALHERAARAAGARHVELDSPLDLDLDTTADLLDAEAALGTIRAGARG